MANQRQRFRARWQIRPGEMGIVVAAQTGVALGMWDAESIVAVDDAGETIGPEFHLLLLRFVLSW
jgi:hypothetical protein